MKEMSGGAAFTSFPLPPGDFRHQPPLNQAARAPVAGRSLEAQAELRLLPTCLGIAPILDRASPMAPGSSGCEGALGKVGEELEMQETSRGGAEIELPREGLMARPQ